MHSIILAEIFIEVIMITNNDMPENLDFVRSLWEIRLYEPTSEHTIHHSNFSTLMHNSQIFRNDFVCDVWHVCDTPDMCVLTCRRNYSPDMCVLTCSRNYLPGMCVLTCSRNCLPDISYSWYTVTLVSDIFYY